MKKLWTILSVLAIANLLAMLGFVGYLKATDRLSMDRMRELREKFTATVTQDNAKKAQAEADKKAAETKATEEAKASKPPLNAEQQLATRVELSQLDQQRLQRLREEIEGLRKTLASERADLDRRQAKFDADQKAFADQVAQFTQSAGDEQFKKTLGILQSVKAKEAKAMLTEMLSGFGTDAAAAPALGANTPATAAQTPPANSADQRTIGAFDARYGRAARYLNAMDERARTKIMSEFAKDNPKLAVDLLEALRKQGEFVAQAP